MTLFRRSYDVARFYIPPRQVAPKPRTRGFQNLLHGLSGQFETFIISFLVVGAFWTAHHRVFDKIKRYDQTLVWLNFVFLLFIVFVPFPSAVVVSARAPGFPSRFMHQTSLAQDLRSLWCGCTYPTTFGLLTRAHRFAKSAEHPSGGCGPPRLPVIDTRGFRKPAPRRVLLASKFCSAMGGGTTMERCQTWLKPKTIAVNEVLRPSR